MVTNIEEIKITELNQKLLNLNKLIEEKENILKMEEDKLPQEYKRLQDELNIRDRQIETLKNALDRRDENVIINEENIKYIEDLKILAVEKDKQINNLMETINKMKIAENGKFYILMLRK